MLQKRKRYFDVWKGGDITKNAPWQNQDDHANAQKLIKRNKRHEQIVTHDLSKERFGDKKIERHQQLVKRLHLTKEIRGKVSRKLYIRKLN